MQLVSLMLIHWIEIYPMDSAIQLLNNWGLPVSDGTCKIHKRYYCLFVGKAMIKVSWDLAESWEYANVPGNTNISLKTVLLAFDDYIYNLLFFVSLDFT